ncbi:hypothetical protein GCM10007382_04170 [Salinibacterium xinjiangense]|uniref:Uncharacterized protein n=1 Tax=Salinibacterium xinjiangense TaxID=386302 RepID=A0A2C8ZLL5_9MICO|nr:hypothetical protein GCM10007382_04170 [Salinibacterium xinjiangense]SOE65831.1 hypothetical protein SAMN06296378_1627 [Salinibacterium xinjiangense]
MSGFENVGVRKCQDEIDYPPEKPGNSGRCSYAGSWVIEVMSKSRLRISLGKIAPKEGPYGIPDNRLSSVFCGTQSVRVQGGRVRIPVLPAGAFRCAVLAPLSSKAHKLSLTIEDSDDYRALDARDGSDHPVGSSLSTVPSGAAKRVGSVPER